MRRSFLGVLSFAVAALTSLAQPVSGPLVSTNRGVPVFTQTNGKKIDPSPVYIDAQGNLYFGGPGTVIVNDMTTAERNALSATNGMVIYNTTTGTAQVRQAGVWVDLATVAGTGVVAPNITALAAIDPSANGVATLLGYNTPFDGGGGRFYGTNTVTGTNTGTRIASTAAGWSWQRLYDGSINARWFGATGNGSTDDGVALQTTLNQLTNGVDDIFIPDGTYKYTNTLSIPPSALYWRIAGESHKSVLWYHGGSTNALELKGPSGAPIQPDAVIEHLRVLGTNTTGNATGLRLANCYKVQVRNCRFEDFAFAGLYLDPLLISDDMGTIHLSRVHSLGNDYGIKIGHTSNAIRDIVIDGLSDFEGNRKFNLWAWANVSSLHIINSAFFCGPGVAITNVWISSYGALGFQNNYVEGGLKQMVLTSSGPSVPLGGSISANSFQGITGTSVGIQIGENAIDEFDGLAINGNWFIGTTNGVQFIGLAKNSLLGPNSFRGGITTKYNDPPTGSTVTIVDNNNFWTELHIGKTGGLTFQETATAGVWLQYGKEFSLYDGNRGNAGLTINTNGSANFFSTATSPNFVSPIVSMGDPSGNAGVIFTNAPNWVFMHGGKGVVFHNTQTGISDLVINTNGTVAVPGTLAATAAITLNANNIWALTPGANVTFSTNTGTKVMTINSTGSGGGGSGSGSLQNGIVIGSGANYSILTNYALVDFGGGDPSLTLPAAGRYLLTATLSGYSPNTFQKDFKFRDTTAGVNASTNDISVNISSGTYGLAVHAIYESPGANTVQLWARMNDTAYAGVHEVISTNTTFSYVRLDGVLGFNVNGSSVSTPNLRNVAATGTVPSATWAVSGTNLDGTIGPATATEAGVVTTGTQSFDGDKTFLASVNVTNALSANSVVVSNLSGSLPVQSDGSDGLISEAINLGSGDVTGVLALGNIASGYPFANLGTGTNSALMAGSFKNTVTELSDIETLSGATPTIDWNTQPHKFLVAATNITFGEANRPASAVVGESLMLDITNSVATDCLVSLPAGWVDETLIGFTNLVAGKSVTIVARWTGAGVKYYWRTYEFPYDTVVTGAFTLATTDHGKLFNNLGASSLTTYTLPAADAGLSFEFVVADTDGIKVLASGNDTIRIGASVTVNAGSITNSVIGGTLKVTAINSTNYYGVWSTGTWNF